MKHSLLAHRLMLALMLLAGLFTFNAPNKAQAQEDARQNVTAYLVAEHESVRANEPFWIAVHEDIRDGWHVYWKNPGDSGLETTVKWDLPDGFEITPLQWPAPHKIPFYGLMNFGYENALTLMAQVTPPANFTGNSITIKGTANWLVCQEICIPETQELSLTLPVRDAAPKDSEAAPLFAAARQLLPRPAPVEHDLQKQNGEYRLTLRGFRNYAANVDNVYFFPHKYGFIDYLGDQRVSWDGNDLTVALKPAADPVANDFSGVLTLEIDGKRKAYEMLAGDDLSLAGTQVALEQKITLSYASALLFALLGGIILNLMPCVFPVLSIKALGLVKKAEKSVSDARKHGVAYTVGVIASFLVLAGLLMALKAGGEQIGWGFQLQSPVFVGFMVFVFFLFGLSLAGIFEIGGNLMNLGGKLANKEGVSGTFFTGVLATIVATPCTAPFMGPAMGLALTLSVTKALGIFAALGLGLALPYLLIATVPALAKRLPKPGAWMAHFKHFMAFPMFASALWLIWVLGQQVSFDGVILLMIGLLVLVFGLWLKNFNKWLGIGLIVLSLLFPLYLETQHRDANTTIEQDSLEQIFSMESLKLGIERGQPVFVNMTAAWCITCKANENIALKDTSVRRAMMEKNVLYLKGDWTNRDPVITEYLESFGRSGVPIYVLYNPKDPENPVVLPQLLTPGIVRDALDKL